MVEWLYECRTDECDLSRQVTYSRFRKSISSLMEESVPECPSCEGDLVKMLNGAPGMKSGWATDSAGNHPSSTSVGSAFKNDKPVLNLDDGPFNLSWVRAYLEQQ